MVLRAVAAAAARCCSRTLEVLSALCRAILSGRPLRKLLGGASARAVGDPEKPLLPVGQRGSLEEQPDPLLQAKWDEAGLDLARVRIRGLGGSVVLEDEVSPRTPIVELLDAICQQTGAKRDSLQLLAGADLLRHGARFGDHLSPPAASGSPGSASASPLRGEERGAPGASPASVASPSAASASPEASPLAPAAGGAAFFEAMPPPVLELTLLRAAGPAVRAAAASGRRVEVLEEPLADGAQCHFDRSYRFLSLGGFAGERDLRYVKTCNDDKNTPHDEVMWTLVTRVPTTVYLNFRSARHVSQTGASAWLDWGSWQLSPLAGTVSSGVPNGPYCGPVYAKDFPPGSIELMGSGCPEGAYFVFVKLLL